MKNEILNISLNDLAEIEFLSRRTINVCRHYCLNDIKSILEFYWEYGNFLRLKKLGSKSNLELINLCLKYENKTEDSSNILSDKESGNEFNKKLEELVLNDGLSVRAQNLCEYNNLKDIKSIVQYYWENKNFKKIRNCGQLSNLELIALSEKYENEFIKTKRKLIIENYTNPLIDKIEKLSIRKKAVINNIIESKLIELSFRTFNALRSYFNNDFSINNIKLLLIYQETKIKGILNIGEKSIDEINKFKNTIIDLIELVSTFESEEDIKIELFNAYLVKLFPLDQAFLSVISKNYDFSTGLPVFKTIKLLIENKILFNHTLNPQDNL